MKTIYYGCRFFEKQTNANNESVILNLFWPAKYENESRN